MTLVTLLFHKWHHMDTILVTMRLADLHAYFYTGHAWLFYLIMACSSYTYTNHSALHKELHVIIIITLYYLGLTDSAMSRHIHSKY